MRESSQLCSADSLTFALAIGSPLPKTVIKRDVRSERILNLGCQRYNGSAMNSWLFKIAVLSSTFGMVLPTGWCCASSPGNSVPAAHATEAVAQRPCCQRRQLNRRADSGSRPTTPNLRCCCQRDAALPVKRVQQSVAPTVVLPVVICDSVLGLGSTLSWIVSRPSLDEGPPLNLLKCVWRC